MWHEVVASCPSPGKCKKRITEGVASGLRWKRRSGKQMTAAALLLISIACSSSPLEPIDGTEIATISLSPDSLSTAVGRIARFSIAAFDKDGNEIRGAPVSFHSSDPAAVVVVGVDQRLFELPSGHGATPLPAGKHSADTLSLPLVAQVIAQLALHVDHHTHRPLQATDLV